LQKEKIIHHSIKPENIWLHNGEAKLTGFEFAEILENDSEGI
jgi:serine/threonine protein kinase